MLIRPGLQITITALHDGAALQFPKDRRLIDSLKARFPKARWGSCTKSWHVPGKLAVHRTTLWAAQQQAYLDGLEAKARDAEWDGKVIAPVAPPLIREDSRPSRQPPPRIRTPMTTNQYHAIVMHMRQRGISEIMHPDAPDPHPHRWIAPVRVDYFAAQRIIQWLINSDEVGTGVSIRAQGDDNG
jgi:hypothetical protein